jgi:class 3 adenylate cyclase
VNCPACAHANRPGAKFCEECAAALPRACGSCGSELRPSAKFCDECGAPTGAATPARPAAASDSRKVVTIVFADLVGSTALHERLDPESARRFMEGYYAAMRGAVESHGGSVTQFLGDGVKAVFGIPRVAEDDAIRAVRAAVAMQAAFRAHADPQREAIGKTGLRVAVNTGEVVANDASEIIGDPVNVAARLQEQGRDGDVVVGETTERLVSALVTLERLGSFALKGRTEAVSAYRVTSLERPVGAAAAAFVGRDAELGRILSVYDTAVEKPATALAVLLGSPGLGKSRLIEEFARRLGDGATVIHAHCDAAGGATFAPLADALRALPDLDALLPGSDAERTRILDGVRALLAGSPAPPEETFFVVRRLLAALASTRPVVLVIDDVHWAEPLLLDLIEHLVQWGVGVPLLVLIGARPELREIRSTLVTAGGLVSDVVTLSGLDAGAAMRLAANVIGAADLPASVAAKVLAASEGNPLFVGELVRMLVHEGALKREGERWTAGTALAALEMPPTIQALLAARIERLRAEERIVLERAAVIGRSFSRSAVAELLSRDVTDLDARLESLRRAELIERDSGWFLGEPLLRFHHVLIRDAAYRRILKGTRAELHARFADWVEARAGGSLEHDETIGWHLEQAHQHLRELGPLDARGRALGERAAQRLAAAGRRALARDDVPLASGLLGRALERLDRDDAARAELALDWCEALLAAGDVAPATAALEELDRFAASDARLRAWHTCFAGQLKVLTAPSGLSEAAESVASASRELAELGDVAGEAKAHFVHAQAFARLGKVAACEAALDRALAAARRAGDRRRANTVLAVAPLAALWGPSPVTRASGRCLDVVRVLRITQGAPAVEAVALSCQGVLEALRGRTDAARRMIASARKMVEELGITQRLLEADVFAARIDLLDGDAAAAERRLRVAYEGMRELGLGIDAARAAALLARALLALDRAGEAEALTHESERFAGDDLQAAIAWRGARAEALARRGEIVEAVALASKAVEIAAATDALLDHADARLALAAALRAAGRNAEADTEEGRATELWVAKGATLLAERARRASPQPAATAVQPEARLEPARPARVRVRANRATPGGSRFEPAVAARDLAALEHLFSDPCVVVHHPTGATYGRSEQLKTWRSMFRAEHFSYRRDVLATLGDSLELVRHCISISGFAEERLKSTGPADVDEFVIYEADADGRFGRFEIFADDRLGAAIARLYERHAELLPDGLQRARAQAIARTARVMLGQPDLAATATVLAPDVEFADLRTVGFGTLRGAEAVLQKIAAMMDLSRDDSAHIDDLLVLESDALVVRWTNRGTQVESGGAFERKLCQLFAFDSAGLLSRWQQFEAEHDGAALARFDALATSAGPKHRSRRRVRPNLAGETLARMDAACAARDVDAVRALHREDFEEIHHPTGSTYGLDGAYASLASLLRLPNPRMVSEQLATLDDRLVLARRTMGASSGGRGRIDTGPWDREEISAAEVDEQGRFRGYDTFGPERLADAIVRLYKRRADLLPDGIARIRAAATAQSLSALLAPPDIDRIASAIASNVETDDHKTLGYGRARGAENVLRAIRIQIETAEAIAPRVDDVLALEPSSLLVRRTVSGVLRDGGGAYEKLMISLYVCGEDGLVEHWEQFDPEREEEALARFEVLVGGSSEPESEPFANAAARADRRLFACFHARDWEGVLALAAPELVFDERRRMLRNTCGRDVWLEQFRILFDVPSSRFTSELLATRGERLSLNVHRFEGEVAGGGGPLAMDDHYALHEVDREGRIVAIVLFDQHDLDAAYTELDARFDAGEGAEHAHVLATVRTRERAHASRDWDAWGATATPGFRYRDHRLLGWGAGDVPAGALIPRSLIELAPDVRVRRDHIRLCQRGALQQITNRGTRDGGAFEIVFVSVIEMDAAGRVLCIDTYDVDRVDLARARFEELRTITPAPFANTASRLVEHGVGRLWAARDWDGILAAISPAIRMDDRRRIMRLEIGYEEFIAQFRMLFDQPGSRWREALVATRGERLSLHRTSFDAEVAGGGGELSFDEHLSLTEVDADGRWIASVAFDLDDADAAYAELDARFAAGEGQSHAAALTVMLEFTRAVASQEWDRIIALCSPTVVEEDHRPLAVLGTTRGAEAWARNFRTLAELAPDSRYRVDHFRAGARGFCSVGTWVGTREGGPYEIPLVAVLELDAQDRIARGDIFDFDQLDLARARFDELRAASALARRFESTATRTFDEVIACLRARDWDRLARLLPAEFHYSDRQRMVQLELDRERYLEFMRPLHQMSTTVGDAEVLATRGDRLLLGRRRVTLSDAEFGPSELEHINVFEVDARGRLIALVRFDATALDAAHAELDARFEAGEGAAHPRASTWVAEFRRAFAARDWPALAVLHAPDQIAVNHRTVGWGTLRGAGAWVPTMEALVGLAADTRLRIDHLRTCERGFVWTSSWQGTRDGGAFETPLMVLVELDAQGRQQRMDVWDIEQLEVALARFEEIRAGAPARARSEVAGRNAAGAAMVRWGATFDSAVATGDWGPMRALCTPQFAFDDRRRFALLSGGIELMIASARERVVIAAWPESNTIGTAGDRVEITRVLWTGGPQEGRFEIEYLAVVEIDASGLISAFVFLDPDDARAAQREAWKRWAAIDPSSAAVTTALGGMIDAFNEGGGLGGVLADDVVVDDRRRAGMGRVEGLAAYEASVDALRALAPGSKVEAGWRWLAHGQHGGLSVLRRTGTIRDGGVYEVEHLFLLTVARGLVTRLEFFELEDADAALARFEELRPDPLRVPPNAASRALASVPGLAANGDVEAIRALVTEDFCLDDRSRRGMLRGGVEEWLGGIQFLFTETAAVPAVRLVATAGERLALIHLVWRETPGKSSFEIERLQLIEVDAAGKLSAMALFDGDQRAAASEELFERYVASAPENMPPGYAECIRGFNRHDPLRLRSALADDFVLEDHRRTGMGRIEGADAYVASVVAAYELSSDSRLDMLFAAAEERHGRLDLVRVSGTNTEGGAFESFHFVLAHFRGEWVAGFEAYEPEEIERALARLEALRPDPKRTPETAATRARDRQAEAFVARDWEALLALAGSDFVFDDRGRRALVTGDAETWIRSMQFTSQPGFRAESSLLAALGDRICLDTVGWRAKPGGDAFEFDRVRIIEVDGDGRLRTLLYFDPEDRPAAFAEALRRFVSGEAGGCISTRLLAEFLRALNDRDWPALRETYTADFALTDLRPLGLGVLDRDTWIASLQATVELSVGLAFEVSRVLAWNDRGVVVVLRRHGSMPEGGGRFENFPIGVALTRGDRIARYELFDEAEGERALARFEELCSSDAQA